MTDLYSLIPEARPETPSIVAMTTCNGQVYVATAKAVYRIVGDEVVKLEWAKPKTMPLGEIGPEAF